jgi:hypothetical protein
VEGDFDHMATKEKNTTAAIIEAACESQGTEKMQPTNVSSAANTATTMSSCRSKVIDSMEILTCSYLDYSPRLR